MSTRARAFGANGFGTNGHWEHVGTGANGH